jgi:hypothetical protein
MPGLLRGIARTAVVAGTATAVSGRVARRQAERFADRDAQIYAQREQAYQQQTYEQQAYEEPAAPPPAASTDDMIEQLRRLGELRDQGVLTDEEFAAQKARILSP